jgi:hypothetical protein
MTTRAANAVLAAIGVVLAAGLVTVMFYAAAQL